MPSLQRAFNLLPGTVRGAIWMVLGGLFLTLLAIVIRHLQQRYNVLEMILMRSVVSFLLILPWRSGSVWSICGPGGLACMFSATRSITAAMSAGLSG